MRVALDALRPNPNNPKDHDVGGIVTSIRRFGYLDRIEVDQGTGYIVAGHGRYLALKALQAEPDAVAPAGVTVEGGRWFIDVDEWAFTSALDAQAYLIANNRLTEVGGWDEVALSVELGKLALHDAELAEVTGYDLREISDLMARVAADDEPDASLLCPHCGKPIF